MTKIQQNPSEIILALARQSIATRSLYRHQISKNAIKVSAGNITNLNLLYAVCFEKVRTSLSVETETYFYYKSSYYSIESSNDNTLAEDVSRNLHNIKTRTGSSKETLNKQSVIFTSIPLNQDGVLLFEPDNSMETLCIKHPSPLQDFLIELMDEVEHLIAEPKSNPKINLIRLQQSLNNIPIVKDTESIESLLQGFFKKKIDYNLSFVQNGGDSITGIRLISKLRELHFELNFTDLMSRTPLNDVLKLIIKNEINDTQKKEISDELSFMQKRIFLYESLMRGSNTHHEQFTYQLKSVVASEKVEEAFAMLWKKYKNLRYNYQSLLNNTVEYHNKSDYHFKFIQNADSLQKLLDEDINLGYNKTMLRLTYVESCQGNSFIIWNHHHMLLDGWSNSILISEFLNNIQTSGNETVIERNDQGILLEIESNINKNEVFEYYKKFYSTYSPAQLHFNSKNNSPRKVEFDLESTKIDTFVQKHGVPASQFFLGSLFLMLYANYGKSGSFIDVISSGRNLSHSDIDRSVGLFIRNIPVGLNINKESNGIETVAAVSEQLVKSLQHEIIPDDLEENIEVNRSDILFVFENYPIFSKAESSMTGSLIEYSDKTGYPLSVYVFPKPNIYQIKFVFNENLLTQAEASAFLNKYQSFIKTLLTKPTTKIKELGIGFPIKKQPVKGPELWIDRVENNITLNKIRIGSSEKSECLEGQELRNRLIHYKGIINTTPKSSAIGVLVKRDANLPIIAYSIMSSGRIYLPLNPSWPYSRIKECLLQANCVTLFSDYYKDELISDNFELIDQSGSSSTGEDFSVDIRENDIAYMLFTSGSTGKPKGVYLTHKNLSAFFKASQEVLDKYKFSSIKALTNIGFDLSIFELLFPWYVGCTLRVLTDLTELEKALSYSPYNLVNTVPSVIRALDKDIIENIYLLHTAGEVFDEALYNKVKSYKPSLNIINWYGPTETTTYSTFIDLSEKFSNSIGSPLSYENLFILDYLGNVQEELLPGEIIITGNGVSKGYLEKNNDSFFNFAGENAYATGDFGIIENGQVVLLGRRDKQVKKLGQRFDLREIEQSIKAEFEVTGRVLCEMKEKQVYLFIEGQTPLDEVQLFLKEKLPNYMHPDHVTVIKRFPENSNGKVDLAKLISNIEINPEDVCSSPDQSLLQELKNRNNYFDRIIGSKGFITQGGDSLVALRLVGALKTLGYSATVQSLLNSETVNDWLSTLRQNKPTEKEQNKKENPLTMIQEWFLTSYKGNKNHFNQSLLLRIENDSLLNPLKEYLNKIAERFPIFSKAHNGSGWVTSLEPYFEELEISNGGEIETINNKLQTIINLETGPVFASAIIHDTDKSYLLIIIHHLYCDGITWRLLFDQFSSQDKVDYEPDTLYNAANVSAKNDVLMLPKHDKAYFGREPVNPFIEPPGNYKDSLNIEICLSELTTSKLISDWKPNASMQKKVFILFMQSWISVVNDPVSVFMESHGRNASEIDHIFDVPGWFTVFYPIHYQVANEDLGNIDSCLEEIYNSAPKLVNAYMAMNKESGYPPFPILLNYLGNFDEGWNQHFTIVDQKQAIQVDILNERLANIEFNSYIKGGRFHAQLRTPNRFDIKSLAAAIEQHANKSIGEDSINFSAHGDIKASDLSKISQLLKK